MDIIKEELLEDFIYSLSEDLVRNSIKSYLKLIRRCSIKEVVGNTIVLVKYLVYEVKLKITERS